MTFPRDAGEPTATVPVDSGPGIAEVLGPSRMTLLGRRPSTWSKRSCARPPALARWRMHLPILEQGRWLG